MFQSTSKIVPLAPIQVSKLPAPLLPAGAVEVATFAAEPLALVHTGWLTAPDLPVCDVVLEAVARRSGVHRRADRTVAGLSVRNEYQKCTMSM